MRITLFDVALETVRDKDLETIRLWRNSDKIRMRMEYRDFITPEQHQNWYKEFSDYKTAFAYMIVYKGEQIGVINSKNRPDHSEGGMFIWDDRYLGSIVPVVVSLLKTDMNFYFMKNESSYIKILNDNYSAISFNAKLGYKLCTGQEGKYNQQYVLTKDVYEKNVPKFKKMLEIYYHEPYQVNLLGSQEDVDSGLIGYYLQTFHQNDGGIKLSYPGQEM